MSVTAGPGLRGRRARVRASSRRATPDLALVATVDRRAGRRRRRVHHQPRRRRAGADQPRATWPTAAPPRWCSTPATPTRPPATQGRADALRMCELTATGLGCATDRRARVLDRPHRHPDADGPGRGRHPEARRAAHRRRRRRRAPRPRRSHHRHRAARDACSRRRSPAARPRPSAAWPRARRCSRRRWPRCSRCSPPTPPSSPTPLQRALQAAVDEQLQRAGRRRVHEHQRHRARARQRRRRQRADHRHDAGLAYARASSRRSPPCAPTSRTRWPPTPRARRSSSPSPCAAPAPRTRRSCAARAGGGEPARAVLALRQGPVLGPGALRARRERRVLRPERVDIAYDGIIVCRARHRRRARRGRGRRASMERARHRDRVRPPRRPRRGDDAASPTSPTRTSTRTWARRDR